MKVPVISSFIFLLCSCAAQAQVIITFAGIPGVYGFSGDGGPAGNAVFHAPLPGAFDNKGNLYIPDLNNFRVRKIDSGDTISTFAGAGYPGFSGDGGPATAALFGLPFGVAVDKADNVYISDKLNNCIRRVDTNGIITTVVGQIGVTTGYSGDGGPATLAQLNYPTSITFDKKGNMYIADEGNNVVRKVNTNGIITTVAGNGTNGYAGDDGPATNAEIGQYILNFYDMGIAVDTFGNLFVTGSQYNTVRKVDTNGIIMRYAGTGPVSGSAGFAGDGGPATEAKLHYPSGLAVDGKNSLYICDALNFVVRKVTPEGIITTFAGTDTVGGWGGDGGPATNALLVGPIGITFDRYGNAYFEDGNNCIREVIIGGVTGVNSVASVPSVNIFPNPFFDVIYVTGLPTSARYCVFSMLGQEVQAGLLQPGKNSIALSLPPGVYLIEMTGGDGSRMVTKVVRK